MAVRRTIDWAYNMIVPVVNNLTLGIAILIILY